MNLKKISFALLLLPAVCLAEMQSMTDSDLGYVDGREGVSIGMETYFNTQKTSSTATDGLPLSSSPFNNCAGTLNGCRLGWQIQGRGDGYSILNPNGSANNMGGVLRGEWFMLKDAYFTMKITDLRLDAAYLTNASNATGNTVFTSTSPGNLVQPSSAAYTSYYDPLKFLATSNASGACLLPGVAAGCPSAGGVAYLQASPALAMQYAPTTTSYAASSTGGTSTGYTSLLVGLNVGRMAVEYNTGTSPSITQGYNRDVQGSFSGLVLKDNNSNFAGMAIGGRMYLYGF